MVIMYKLYYNNPSNLNQNLLSVLITGVLKSPNPTRKETSYSDRRFWVSYLLFI